MKYHIEIFKLTDEEIVFTFFDTNMPEFFLTQPEVYEGDTLLEAAPMFVKGFGSFIGAALFLGSILYFTFPLRVQAHRFSKMPYTGNKLSTDRRGKSKQYNLNNGWSGAVKIH